tara:strand:- start:2055 stop:2540 length:486 start_codon:yes stop_codon:yes gene_type:complete
MNNQFFFQDTNKNNFQEMSKKIFIINKFNKVVSQYFFCNQNIEQLQKLLINNVYSQSNQKYKINKLKNDRLKYYMQDVFNNYFDKDLLNLKQQLNQLNNVVLNILVKIIIENLDYNQFYKKNIKDFYNGKIYDNNHLPMNTQMRKITLPTNKRIMQIYDNE